MVDEGRLVDYLGARRISVRGLAAEKMALKEEEVAPVLPV